jgi:hypothetical protein
MQDKSGERFILRNGFKGVVLVVEARAEGYFLQISVDPI